LQVVLSAASQRNQATCARTTRGGSISQSATPAAYIPTPDSTGIVDNYHEFYPLGRWTEPATYIRTSETIDAHVVDGLNDQFTYYLDERDKEWLTKNNEEARGEGTSAQGAVSTVTTTRSGSFTRSAKAKGKEPEVVQPVVITEDEFELVMGLFEKVTQDKTPFLNHVRPVIISKIHGLDGCHLGCRRGSSFPSFL
jgi:enhancer of polycomb-like protein